MLEIIILVKLCQNISAKAKAKGMAGWPFGVLLVALWIGGEIAGFIVGFIVFQDEGGLGIYLPAIVGAVIGALAAFAIVGILPGYRRPDEALRESRWRPADELFDLDNSDPDVRVRIDDEVKAVDDVQPGDLLHFEPLSPGRLRVETVFPDEVTGLPGAVYQAERSAKRGRLILRTYDAAKATLAAPRPRNPESRQIRERPLDDRDF